MYNNYRAPFYTEYGTNSNVRWHRDIRDGILSNFFGMFRIVHDIVFVLAVLNIVGVISVSWWMLLCILMGYLVINIGSDILATNMKRKDSERDRKERDLRYRKYMEEQRFKDSEDDLSENSEECEDAEEE